MLLCGHRAAATLDSAMLVLTLSRTGMEARGVCQIDAVLSITCGSVPDRPDKANSGTPHEGGAAHIRRRSASGQARVLPHRLRGWVPRKGGQDGHTDDNEDPSNCHAAGV